MKTINLPAGTTHVEFGELAHLIADAIWPDIGPTDDRMGYGLARLGLDGELAAAVTTGALPVKNALTLGPHTFPHGAALKSALVTLEDLTAFVAGRGISVTVHANVETRDERCARLLSEFEQEKGRNERGALARVVENDGRARQTVKADIEHAQKKKKSAAANPFKGLTKS